MKRQLIIIVLLFSNLSTMGRSSMACNSISLLAPKESELEAFRKFVEQAFPGQSRLKEKLHRAAQRLLSTETTQEIARLVETISEFDNYSHHSFDITFGISKVNRPLVVNIFALSRANADHIERLSGLDPFFAKFAVGLTEGIRRRVRVDPVNEVLVTTGKVVNHSLGLLLMTYGFRSEAMESELRNFRRAWVYARSRKARKEARELITKAENDFRRVYHLSIPLP